MKVTKFEELGISEEILKAVEEMGFEEASPIQAEAIPAMLTKKDIIGQAQTGQGNSSLCYSMPYDRSEDKHLQGLVYVLKIGLQVADEFRKLAKFMHGIKILPFMEDNKYLSKLGP